MAKATCIVYWLTDDRCVCMQRHGYIGISTRLHLRLGAHRRSGRLPNNFKSTILFEGTVLECRALEFQLRPRFNIGWNENPGGGKTHGQKISAARKGHIKSPEWCAKIAKTLTGLTRTAESRAKQSANARGISKSAEWRTKASTIAADRYADREPRSPTHERGRLAKNAKRAARRAAGLPRLY